MPRYFFHTEDGRSYRDEEGTDLRDLDAAKATALRHLIDLLPTIEDFWESGRFCVIATDADGLTLFTVDVCATMAPAARKMAG